MGMAAFAEDHAMRWPKMSQTMKMSEVQTLPFSAGEHAGIPSVKEESSS